MTSSSDPVLRDDSEGMEQFNTLPRRILVVYLPLAVFVFVLLFPFYWMAITAVKPNHQLTNYQDYSPFWVVGPTLQHIRYLLFETSYPGWLWNTMIVAIFSTIISLAHCLNLRVVAEGVETDEQLKLLRLLRCDEMQGYLFSRPLSADEMRTLIAARAASR